MGSNSQKVRFPVSGFRFPCHRPDHSRRLRLRQTFVETDEVTRVLETEKVAGTVVAIE